MKTKENKLNAHSGALGKIGNFFCAKGGRLLLKASVPIALLYFSASCSKEETKYPKSDPSAHIVYSKTPQEVYSRTLEFLLMNLDSTTQKTARDLVLKAKSAAWDYPQEAERCLILAAHHAPHLTDKIRKAIGYAYWNAVPKDIYAGPSGSDSDPDQALFYLNAAKKYLPSESIELLTCKLDILKSYGGYIINSDKKIKNCEAELKKAQGSWNGLFF